MDYVHHKKYVKREITLAKGLYNVRHEKITFFIKTIYFYIFKYIFLVFQSHRLVFLENIF